MNAAGGAAIPDSSSADRYPSRWRALREHPGWPWIKRGAATAFLLIVLALIVMEARKVQWEAVLSAIHRMPWPALIAAVALCWTSHALYSCYDLLGRRYTGHRLPKWIVVAVNFVSYAFNLNMGYLVGGAGIRLRLYLQLGLGIADIAKILTFSVLTNWLGYMVLAGFVLVTRAIEIPFAFFHNAGVDRVLGVILLLLPSAYIAACAWSRRREVQLRGHRLPLPSARMAVLQVAIATLNWAVMAGAIYALLQQRVEYPAVLCTLLLAAVAGLLSHVPAGLGVLEAVFVTVLASRVGKEELLAVVLLYRAFYYLLPLAVAAIAYLALEAKLKKRWVVAETATDGNPARDRAQ